MKCPLCSSSDSKQSWMGATRYGEIRYEYQECLRCGSMFVHPMPDEMTLARMYGEDYVQFLSSEEAHSGDEGTNSVLDELDKYGKGNFLDYGCGGGHLLRESTARGWTCYGVDFARSATHAVTTYQIVGKLAAIPEEISFDAIHLGDVIEHLPEPDRDLPELISRMKPHGIFVAQGPLEANFNMFLEGLRMKKLLKNTDSTMPPYHVSLATGTGQRALFSRLGLKTIRFDVFETAHPAPESLSPKDLSDVRKTFLFALRKMSRTLSPLLNSSAGNRYFYVGERVD